MYNINDDLNTITTIPKVSLDKLDRKREDIICHRIFEEINNGNLLPQIDIGIGTLYLKISDNDVEYKFIPSKTLENNIVNTIQKNKSPLVKKVEDAVTKRIMKAYKDLF